MSDPMPYCDEEMAEWWVKVSEAPTEAEARAVIEAVRNDDDHGLRYKGVRTVTLWEGEIGAGPSAEHKAHAFECDEW